MKRFTQTYSKKKFPERLLEREKLDHVMENLLKSAASGHIHRSPLIMISYFFLEVICVLLSFYYNFLYKHVYTCILAYSHTLILAYLHTCILAYFNTCKLAYLHTCILAYMCILSYLHILSTNFVFRLQLSDLVIRFRIQNLTKIC